MGASIGVKIQLEGAPQYVSDMKNLTQQTKLYEAQMKKLQKQVNGSTFAKSMAESKALKQTLEAQQNQLRYLGTEIDRATEKYGENSTQVMRLKTQYENLEGKIAQTEAQIRAHGGAIGAVGAQLQEVGSKIEAVGNKIAGIGDKLTTRVTMPLVAAGAASVKAFSDWESAFTGVKKTVDETVDAFGNVKTSYEDIAEGIKKMATETASSKEDIAGVAEVAGQLGVSADNILEFTRTMVMLGDTTNLSADEAAGALARFINITGDSQDDIGRLGSAIVDLGNNFATDEASIVEMSTRLAAAGTIAGLSSTEILGLATAMSSVGIQAEAGGTAMTQTLTGISKAVEDAGDGLKQIAEISGVSAEDFAEKWKTKPAVALQAFIRGLGKLNEEGEATYSVLDELGMSGVRQSNMLQSLSLAADMMGDAMMTSNKAYAENTALVAEAEKRYDTFEAKMSQTKEKIGNVGIEIGERLLPYIDRMLEVVDQLIAKWDEMDPETQDMIVKAAMIAAALGPILSIGGRLIGGIGALVTNIGHFATWVGTLTTSLPSLGAVIGAIASPIGLVIAGVAALVAAFIYFYNTNEEFRAKVTETWNNIKVTAEFIFNAIKEFVYTIIETVRQWLDEHQLYVQTGLTVISEFLKMILQGMMTFINIILAIIRGDWQAAWGYIKQYFIEAFTSMKTILTTILNYIVQTISQKVNEAHQKFVEMKAKITETITALIKEALHWGADMIENFKQGIMAKMQGVLDAVRSMADQIRSYLHFSEPDVGPLKDFNSWPKDMMKQYAEGIDAGRYLVKDAVMDVAADVALLNDPLNADEIYNAVNAGASNANISLSIGGREMTRALKGMGVAFA